MYGLSKEEWQNLVLSVNVGKHQRRLSPYQVAKLLEKALQTVNAPTLASELNFKDLRTFTKIRTLLKAPEDFSELIEWGNRRGSLCMSTAFELLRLQNLSADNLRLLFKACIESDFTKEEARQLVQIHTRSLKPPLVALDEVLKTRPVVQKCHLIIGSLLSDHARENAKSLLKETGMRKINSAFVKLFPDITAQVFRVTNGKFSLLLSEKDNDLLRQSIGNVSVETKITEILEGLA